MADTTSQKPRKLWRFVLVVSLALNLLFVGLIVGSSLRNAGPRGFDVGLGPIGQALSREDRRDIGRQLREDPTLRGAGFRNRREAMQAIVTALQSEPFDPAALQAVLETTREQAGQLQDAAARALVSKLSEMTPQERAAFAQRLSEGPRKRN